MARLGCSEFTVSHRLAVYGSLAPGCPNHDRLAALTGRWIGGQAKGRLVDAGWGAGLGFPGIILDEHAGLVPVQVFESSVLPAHWSRLDAFEGPGYHRVAINVETPAGPLPTYIYALRQD